jgi:ribA/ribD-fused uncharacterized protein
MSGALDIAGHAARIRGLANRKREQELPEADRKKLVAKQERLHELQSRNQIQGEPSKPVKEFQGAMRFLSNFFTSTFEFEGVSYKNAEAAFQAQKTLDPAEREQFSNMTGAQARKAGRRVTLRDGWNDMRVDVMSQIVLAKFKQNAKLAKQLLDTGNAILEEGNTWGDTFWGVSEGRGENHLGRILMRVRQELGGEGAVAALTQSERAEMIRLRREVAELYSPAEQRKIKRFQGIYKIKTEIDLLLEGTDSQVFYDKIDDLRRAMGLHVPEKKYTGYVKETLALAREEIDNFRFGYIARDQQTDLQEIIGNIVLDVANTITDIKDTPDVTHSGALFDAPEEISSLIARDQLVTPTAARGKLKARIDPKKPVPGKPGVLEHRGAKGFGRAPVADAALGRLPTLMNPIQQFHWIQHSIEGFLADMMLTDISADAALTGKTLDRVREIWHKNFSDGFNQKRAAEQFNKEWADTQHIRVEAALQSIELALFRLARISPTNKDGVPIITTFSELKKVLPNNPKVRALLSERERVLKQRKGRDVETLAYLSEAEIMTPHFTVYGVMQNATLEERTNAARRQFTPNLKIPVGAGEVTAPTPFFTEAEARKRYIAWAKWVNSEKAPNLPLPTGTYNNVLIAEEGTAVDAVNQILKRVTEAVKPLGEVEGNILDNQLSQTQWKIETLADLHVYLDSLRATMMLKSARHQQNFSGANRESWAKRPSGLASETIEESENPNPNRNKGPKVGERIRAFNDQFTENQWERVSRLIDSMTYASYDGPTDPVFMDGAAGWYSRSGIDLIEIANDLPETWAYGVAGHESMHALWFQTLNPNERAVLAKAMRSDALMERVIKFFADNNSGKKYTDTIRRAMSPETNALWLEERVAYAFQAFAMSRMRPDIPNFNLPPKPNTIFGKIWAFIKQIIRYTSPVEQSQNLFNYALSGEVKQAHMQGRTLNLRNEGSTPLAAVDAIWNAWRAAQHLIRGFIIPMDSGIRNTRIPALIQLADLIFIGPLYRTIKKAGPTFLNDYTREWIKWADVFQRKWQTLSPQRRANLRDALYSRTAVADLDAQTAADVRWFRAYFDKMRAYVRETGADLGDIPNYVPIHWDAQRVADNEQQLRQLLATVPAAELEAVGGIDAIINNLKQNPDVMGEDRFSANFDTTEISARKRQYSFLNDKDLRDFMSEDFEGTMMGYTKQMTRYAESTRHFGVGGFRVKALLQKAKEQGASPKELEDAHNYVLAARGELGANISESMSKTLAWIATYQHVRVLAFATFASFVEIVGIATRSQSVEASWEALKVAWDQLKNLYTNFPRRREIKKRLDELSAKTRLRPEEDVEFEALVKELQDLETDHDRFAREMGTLDGAVMFDQLIAATGSMPLESWPKRINEALFKWNGLSGWTALTRKMATRAAYVFIKENALHPRKHSERFLQELNLVADRFNMRRSDVIFDSNGELLTNVDAIEARLEELGTYGEDVEARRQKAVESAKKVEQAIWQFVDESVLRPNAATRPLKASDPHWQLLFHMKHYIFTTQSQILNRIYKEAVHHGNFVPVGALAMYPAVALVSDFFRSTIQYGLADEEDEWKNPYVKYSWSELMLRSTRRSGVLGLLEPYTGFGDNINRFGGTGFEVLTGPTIQQGLELSRTILTGSPSAYKAMHNALPLSNVYRNWGIPFN